MAQPDALLTVTGLQRSWLLAQSVMQRLRRWLRGTGLVGAWAYHLEPNPRSAGAHAHVWWRGDPFDSAVLSEAALSSGAGAEAHVEDEAFVPAGHRVPTLEYGMKEVLVGRPAEPTTLWPAAEAYLDLNGGHLVRASRGFWIDWRGQRIEGGLVRARTIAHTWSPAQANAGHRRSCSDLRGQPRNRSHHSTALGASLVRGRSQSR